MGNPDRLASSVPSLHRRQKLLLVAVFLVTTALLAYWAPAIAQPPPVPPEAAELQPQRDLRGGKIEGRVTIPDQKAGVLIQPEGRDWRAFRTRWLAWIGAIAILGMLALLAVFYLLVGRQRIDAGRSGRTVHRYSWLERVNHWMVAGSFVVLGLSGLTITYGAGGIRPLIGAEAFTAFAYWMQAAHHYLSFPFTIGLVVMLALWLRASLLAKVDRAWLRAGGPLAKGHPPAGKFNAAQKLLFWFVVMVGAALAVSGYLLMFPFYVADVTGQQWAHVVHGVLAMLMIAVILGHIYIGTVGTEGALEGMTDGRVDYNYAREHHSLWLEEELAKAHRMVEPPGTERPKPVGAD